MKFAVNYSPESLECFDEGVPIDLIKLPAWQELIDTVIPKYPAYVHLPLKIGNRKGVIDTDTGEPVVWSKIEAILEKTETPFVNLHLGFFENDFPKIPSDSIKKSGIDIAVAVAIREVEEACVRFGPENVIIENEHEGGAKKLLITMLPEVYHRVIEATGCGLLLDISHGRMAAKYLGRDAKEYISSLPVEHIREIHITGIQTLEPHWVDRLRKAGLKKSWRTMVDNRWMDHLPMTDADWPYLDWAMDCVRKGVWGKPWVVAYEVGGIGPFFGTFSDKSLMKIQLPRLYDIVQSV